MKEWLSLISKVQTKRLIIEGAKDQDPITPYVTHDPHSDMPTAYDNHLSAYRSLKLEYLEIRGMNL